MISSGDRLTHFLFKDATATERDKSVLRKKCTLVFFYSLERSGPITCCPSTDRMDLSLVYDITISVRLADCFIAHHVRQNACMYRSVLQSLSPIMQFICGCSPISLFAETNRLFPRGVSLSSRCILRYDCYVVALTFSGAIVIMISYFSLLRNVKRLGKWEKKNIKHVEEIRTPSSRESSRWISVC